MVTFALFDLYSFFAERRILNLSFNTEPLGALSLGRCENKNCGDDFFILWLALAFTLLLLA